MHLGSPPKKKKQPWPYCLFLPHGTSLHLDNHFHLISLTSCAMNPEKKKTLTQLFSAIYRGYNSMGNLKVMMETAFLKRQGSINSLSMGEIHGNPSQGNPHGGNLWGKIEKKFQEICLTLPLLALRLRHSLSLLCDLHKAVSTLRIKKRCYQTKKHVEGWVHEFSKCRRSLKHVENWRIPIVSKKSDTKTGQENIAIVDR